METLIRKLSSRKLWTCVAGIVTGLAIIFGLDANAVNVITGATVSLVSCVIYIIRESHIDAERVKNTVEDIQDAVEVLDKIEI